MTPALQPLCTVQIDFRRVALMPGDGPFGHRSLLPIVGGAIGGDELRGDVVKYGELAVLRGSDGWAAVELRSAWRLLDGTEVAVVGHGTIELNEAVQEAESHARATAFEDQQYRLALRLETGAQQYRWFSRALFVAAARVNPHESGPGVELAVHTVR